ncbi:DUF501 domain-containing protein [Flaviflexus salsibiostraticola]|uniref:DUF501 domain-containing protein n=1 Tax=Flaviflexus salsibiostraticola TaxID=1282737 RepID=UPI001FE488D6|nr:DUF501 domain-containing protein [Flaviflexus salsibiostraticola]
MTVSDKDIASLERQLGRVPRGVIAIAARCGCGEPTVVETAPRLEDGTPFPTLYYLTHPQIVLEVSRLEGSHIMAELTERLETDEQLAEQYRAAHEDYLARRRTHGIVDEIEGVSAGGMPNRVKCLHALVGHSLAVGPGINPIGDLALDMIEWTVEGCTCSRDEAPSS